MHKHDIPTLADALALTKPFEPSGAAAKPSRVHRILDDEAPAPKPVIKPFPPYRAKEETMPRRKRTPEEAEAAGKFNKARFGFFDDGTVQINLPGCRGRLSPENARELSAFLVRAGVKA